MMEALVRAQTDASFLVCTAYVRRRLLCCLHINYKAGAHVYGEIYGEHLTGKMSPLGDDNIIMRARRIQQHPTINTLKAQQEQGCIKVALMINRTKSKSLFVRLSGVLLYDYKSVFEGGSLGLLHIINS